VCDLTQKQSGELRLTSKNEAKPHGYDARVSCYCVCSLLLEEVDDAVIKESY